MRHGDLHGVLGQRRLLGQDFVEQLEAAFPDLARGPSPELALEGAPFLRWIVLSAPAPPTWARAPDWLVPEADGPFDDAFLAAAEARCTPETRRS